MNKLYLAILPYIPKKWKFISFLIMTLPFVMGGLNEHIDGRIDKKVVYIEKTQDSIHVVLEENRESYRNLNRSMDRLNDNVMDLQKWLIQNRSH